MFWKHTTGKPLISPANIPGIVPELRVEACNLLVTSWHFCWGFTEAGKASAYHWKTLPVLPSAVATVVGTPLMVSQEKVMGRDSLKAAVAVTLRAAAARIGDKNLHFIWLIL